jgi:hypothetical protein
MKTNAVKAEVFNMLGEKVYVTRDCDKIDLSKLANDVYLLHYLDCAGRILKTEKLVKA